MLEKRLGCGGYYAESQRKHIFQTDDFSATRPRLVNELSVIPPMRSIVKQHRDGMDFAVQIDINAEILTEPMPYDCVRIVLLRFWATHHNGEVT
jgi:hypothetical protein